MPKPQLQPEKRSKPQRAPQAGKAKSPGKKVFDAKDPAYVPRKGIEAAGPGRAPKKSNSKKPWDPIYVPVRRGAPSGYDPMLCFMLPEMGSKGMSIAEMSANLGIARSTFLSWVKEHEDFAVAAENALTLSQAYWENAGRMGVMGMLPNFNAGAWQFNMKNRFRDDWADVKISQNVGPDGGPTQNEVTHRLDVGVLTYEQREALKEILLTASRQPKTIDAQPLGDDDE